MTRPIPTTTIKWMSRRAARSREGWTRRGTMKHGAAKPGGLVFLHHVDCKSLGPRYHLYLPLHMNRERSPTSFSTLKRVVKGQCSCRPLREGIHTKPEKVKCKCTRESTVRWER